MQQLPVSIGAAAAMIPDRGNAMTHWKPALASILLGTIAAIIFFCLRNRDGCWHYLATTRHIVGVVSWVWCCVSVGTYALFHPRSQKLAAVVLGVCLAAVAIYGPDVLKYNAGPAQHAALALHREWLRVEESKMRTRNSSYPMKPVSFEMYYGVRAAYVITYLPVSVTGSQVTDYKL